MPVVIAFEGGCPLEEAVAAGRRPGDVEAGHFSGDHAQVRVDDGPDLAQEGVDRERVLAHDHVADGLGGRGVGRLGLARDRRERAGLAEADEALVGADADEEVGGRAHLPDGDAERSDEGQVIDVISTSLMVILGAPGRRSGSGAGRQESQIRRNRGQPPRPRTFRNCFQDRLIGLLSS
jgi:hypothetical protein